MILDTRAVLTLLAAKELLTVQVFMPIPKAAEEVTNSGVTKHQAGCK